MTQTDNSTEGKTLNDTSEQKSKVGCLYGMQHRMLQSVRLDIIALASNPEQARQFVNLLATTDWDTLYLEKEYFEVANPF